MATREEQRAVAIQKAVMFRAGKRTIDADGEEAVHASISIAKRFTRERALGRCVAQQRGEDLFALMRKRIEDAAALKEAA